MPGRDISRLAHDPYIYMYEVYKKTNTNELKYGVNDLKNKCMFVRNRTLFINVEI